MTINEFLRYRNITNTQLTTGTQTVQDNSQKVDENGLTFAEELNKQISESKSVNENEGNNIVSDTGLTFSKHAVQRLMERNIDIFSENRINRLSHAVEMAEEKGSVDTLVLMDSTAYIVNVPNNKVITMVTPEDSQGNIFTNIDSTVVI